MKALAIGCGKEQMHAIQKAKENNVYVIGCDGNKGCAGKNEVGKFYHIDINDKESVLQIAKIEQIDFILPSPIGKCIETIGYVNTKLQLKGPMHNVARICANKGKFNEFLAAKEFNKPFQVLYNHKTIDKKLEIPKFPVIIKPQFGSGSKGVVVIRNKHDLVEKLEVHRKSFGDMIVEEFLEGKEYGVDVLIIDNSVVYFNIRDKEITPLPYRQEVQYISPTSCEQKVYDDIKEVIYEFIDRIGLSEGFLHADVIYNNGKVYLIDVAPRPAGQMIHSKIIKTSLGKDLVEEFIQSRITGTEIPQYNPKYRVLLQYNTIHGLVIDQGIKEKLGKMYPEIEEIGLTELNEEVSNIIVDGTNLVKRGYYLLKVELEKDILKINQEILEMLRR